MAPAILFYDVVKWLHIVAVLVGFGGLFTYPLWFAALSRSAAAERAGFHRMQVRLSQWLVGPSLLVIFIAGAYMASDRDLWSEPWVTVPVIIAFVIGGIDGAIISPRARRLAGLAEAGGGAEYDGVLAQMRIATYVAIGLVLLAAFFMVTKLGA